MKKEATSYKIKKITEEIEKDGYLPVRESCPICESFTLERQIFGYETSIFCRHCSYSRIIAS